MGIPLGDIILAFIIVVIVVVIVVANSYYSPSSVKAREKREQEEAERNRKQQMKETIRNGQLTKNVISAIKNANSLGLAVYKIEISHSFKDGRYFYFIMVIYYGHISQLIAPYSFHILDDIDNSENRNKSIRVVCETIDCEKIEPDCEGVFMDVLLENLGSEKYRISRTDIIGSSINHYYIEMKGLKKPWIMEPNPDKWQSNPNWQ